MRRAWFAIRLIPAFAVWPLVMGIALIDFLRRPTQARAR